jgi:hypothetical protein
MRTASDHGGLLGIRHPSSSLTQVRSFPPNWEDRGLAAFLGSIAGFLVAVGAMFSVFLPLWTVGLIR